MKNYMTVSQMAKEFGVSRQYLHELISKGKIRPNIKNKVCFLFTEQNAMEIKAKFFTKE